MSEDDCILCGCTEFRTIEEGLQCIACGAINGPYDDNGPGGFDDAVLEYAQDTAAFHRQAEAEDEDFREQEKRGGGA